ncbi:hypothetical protein B0H16DRAFT_780314 [Mycena metata]|uniref:Fruit-body specific protein a n=1 Tax=Mycena metata TaxID=1033252 RepID=A0AAD7GKT2_9AGAR|nr:hypothetical protein B0H16DRAFT_780314 [Mycena metata]
MPAPSRLLALAALLVSATALVPPAFQVNGTAPANTSVPMPDNDAIARTAGQVDQKSGPAVDAAPNTDVPPTTVTAVDGTLTNTTVAGATSGPTRRRDVGRFGKRQPGFEKVFDGKPTGEHDASIEGTAYLTYTVVNNATYNVQACLDWCAGINGCVFVNVYYEFNNYLLDFVFGEHSNLKCAAYGDIHGAAEKTNFGGQASYPQVGDETVPLTYITQSSGWALDSLVDPTTPDGYDLVFGPTGGANNAPGYMGFAFLDKYDVDACAQLCNARDADPNGGGCAYFNIWRAVVSGVPTTYTCSMYYLVADESTALNFGQGDLVVTYSRGYARTSLLPDGGFESFTDSGPDCDGFCFTEEDTYWIASSPSSGGHDATIFFDQAPFWHSGHSAAAFGDIFEENSQPGTLRPAKPLDTKPGVTYDIQCFMGHTFGEVIESPNPAKLDILWNGARVGGVSMSSPWQFMHATVVAQGNDLLSFVGGQAPYIIFLDDCFVYQA